MKNDITELVFILDRSGSMAGLEADTIGGFNALVEKQRKEAGACYVTTYLFDSSICRIHDRVTLDKIAPMTGRDYTPGGCTALLDAIGQAICHIAHIHKYAKAEDVPAHTVFVITTDGMENASRVYDIQQVRRMIEHEKEKYGWEFLFLAANIDAVTTAERFGICADRAVDYRADSAGTACMYEAVGQAVSQVRRAMPMGSAWRAGLDRDFKKRGKK